MLAWHRLWTDSTQHSLLQHGQHLKDLTLDSFDNPTDFDGDLSPMTSLERLEISNSNFAITIWPTGLRTLKFDNDLVLELGERDSPPDYLADLTHLECRQIEDVLRLLGPGGDGLPFKRDMISLICSYFVSVSDLAEEQSQYINAKVVLGSERMKNLQHLSLLYQGHMDNVIVPIITKHLLQLESVDFRHSNITGYGVKQLVLNLPKLKSMRLDSCDNLSYDAVEWARSRGIHTTYLKPEMVTCKRVRYG